MTNCKVLSNTSIHNVRFSEIDSMGIMWHGHYLQLLEEARESFGKHFALGYMDVYRQGFKIPLVEVNVQYKKPIKYEDVIEIKTDYIDHSAAKIVFEYTLFHHRYGTVAAKAKTVQVFLNEMEELQLTVPIFFEDWKKANGLI